MPEDRIDERDDERLRRLLEVEQRLQDLVRAAAEDARRHVAAARAASELRLAAAREAAKQVDAECAGVERAAHERALAAIDTASRAALGAIASLSDERVDELARWALAQACGTNGEPA